jgi:hypothetical protein
VAWKIFLQIQNHFLFAIVYFKKQDYNEHHPSEKTEKVREREKDRAVVMELACFNFNNDRYLP